MCVPVTELLQKTDSRGLHDVANPQRAPIGHGTLGSPRHTALLVLFAPGPCQMRGENHPHGTQLGAPALAGSLDGGTECGEVQPNRQAISGAVWVAPWGPRAEVGLSLEEGQRLGTTDDSFPQLLPGRTWLRHSGTSRARTPSLTSTCGRSTPGL